MARGPVMTADRKQLLAGLASVGGSLVANGDGVLRPDEVKKRLGLSCKNPTPLLYRAEKDGLIRREVNATRTLAIHLVGDLPVKRGPGRPPKDPNAPQRPRRLPRLQLPTIGDQVTVAMLSQDRDGHVQLGLRNDAGSWVVTLESFAAAEVAGLPV